MRSASYEVRDAGRRAGRWAVIATLALLAGCTGERRESSAAGNAGAAVTDSVPTTTDTARTAAADSAGATQTDTATGTTAAADTTTGTVAAADTPAAGPARDTAAAQQATRPAAPAKPAAPARPKPAAPAKPQPTPPAPDTPTTAATQDTGGQGGATGETATTEAPMRDAYHQAPRDTVDADTYDGWKQYNLNCARCHGEDVLGSTIAPHLVMSLKPDGPINTQELFVQVVCAGRPAKGMPSWCALGMDPATINKIYAYVKGRSEGKIGPGRPARKPEG